MAKKTATKTGTGQTYLGNGKHQWEASAPDVMRLRVPGGWLYATTMRSQQGYPVQFTTCFVPIPATMLTAERFFI